MGIVEVITLVGGLIIAPIATWNMVTTLKSKEEVTLLKYEVKELQEDVLTCRENDKRIDSLENNGKDFHEAIGGIKSDLHDIRNFLVRVITKDDPEKVNELVDTLMKPRGT